MSACVAGGAIYLAILSWQLALSCLCMTTLLWAVALRFGSYSRASNRAYMAELANTNQVPPNTTGCIHLTLDPV